MIINKVKKKKAAKEFQQNQINRIKIGQVKKYKKILSENLILESNESNGYLMASNIKKYYSFLDKAVQHHLIHGNKRGRLLEQLGKSLPAGFRQKAASYMKKNL